MRFLRPSSEDEMVACYLKGELSSPRFGTGTREALIACGQTEELLIHADLTDADENAARRAVLSRTRGYGEDREMFEGFAARVSWIWAMLSPAELMRVRYIEYSYWNELSGGSRLPADAAVRIRAGVEAFGVSNQRFLDAVAVLASGDRFPPLILAGPRHDDLVCLEGHLRLTAYALAGFPHDLECLVGTAPGMERWAR